MKNVTAPDVIIEGKLILQLYVSGMSPKSLEAIQNIKELCDKYLKDAFELEIIDIYKTRKLHLNKVLYLAHPSSSSCHCQKKF
jgi:circadian clock protein KaiB